MEKSSVGARRTILLCWGAGAFLLVLLSVWVFRASLREQRKPRSSFGAKGFEYSMPGAQNLDPNSPANNPQLDPHVHETLRTIDEINRIKQLNLELQNKMPTGRENAPKRPSSNAGTPPKSPLGQQEDPAPSPRP